MFVLDTNTLIYLFQGKGNVESNLLRQSMREIAIPTVVIYELEVGIAKSAALQKRTQQLQRLIDVVMTLPFDRAEAAAAAQVRVALERQGTPIGRYDILIAGTALAHNATLVTHNTAEFSRVASLNIVDWF